MESSSSASEYGDLTVEEGSPVNPDLHFDSQLMHLYVMTERKVSVKMFLLVNNELLFLRLRIKIKRSAKELLPLIILTLTLLYLEVGSFEIKLRRRIILLDVAQTEYRFIKMQLSL